MSRLLQSLQRLITPALVTLAFVAALSVAAGAQPAPRPGPPPPEKKKLPAGSRGFAQFAGRDASDKLLTGAATRGAGDANPEATALALYEQGEQLHKAGQHAQARQKFMAARDAFAKASRVTPDNAEIHYHLGVAYETLQQYPEAIKAYREAVSRTLKYPADLFASYNLANAHAALGQHVEAVEAYQQVLRLSPGLAMPHYNMGLSYAAINPPRHAEAIKEFQEAIRLQPEADKETNKQQLAQTYYNLGVTHGAAGQFEEAAVAFTNAVRLAPADADVRYNLALAHITLGNRPAANAQIAALRRTKPELARELSKLMPK